MDKQYDVTADNENGNRHLVLNLEAEPIEVGDDDAITLVIQLPPGVKFRCRRIVLNGLRVDPPKDVAAEEAGMADPTPIAQPSETQPSEAEE